MKWEHPMRRLIPEKELRDNKSLKQETKKYEKYLQALFFVADNTSLDTKKNTEWIAQCKPISTRFIFQSLAFMDVVSGTEINLIHDDEQSKSKDLFISVEGAHTLFRAQFETYLLYHFIFISPQTEDEMKFRSLIWQFGNLWQQQKAIEQKTGKETFDTPCLNLMERIKKEIESSPYFLALSKNQQTCILKGDSKILIKWTEINKQAGFEGVAKFKGLYAYLCSSYFFNEDTYSWKANSSEAAKLMQLSGLLICRLIFNLQLLHKDLEKQFKKLPVTIQAEIKKANSIFSS